MKINILPIFATMALISLLFSCRTSHKSSKTLSKAEQIIQNTILAHGGDKYDKAHYQFVFRNKTYTFENNGDLYEYTVLAKKDDMVVESTLNNDGLTRTSIGQPLTEKNRKAVTGSINSVIYFATLPHKLKDQAVNKRYVGSTRIKGKEYEVVEISFDEKGGGTDHDDIFYYWINKETSLIDYLAYNYQVNGGGVRFRSAYNTRKVGGIIFQDYINYKADVGTPLGDLPQLWEQGQLKELSRIETEAVKEL